MSEYYNVFIDEPLRILCHYFRGLNFCANEIWEEEGRELRVFVKDEDFKIVTSLFEHCSLFGIDRWQDDIVFEKVFSGNKNQNEINDELNVKIEEDTLLIIYRGNPIGKLCESANVGKQKIKDIFTCLSDAKNYNSKNQCEVHYALSKEFNLICTSDIVPCRELLNYVYLPFILNDLFEVLYWMLNSSLCIVFNSLISDIAVSIGVPTIAIKNCVFPDDIKFNVPNYFTLETGEDGVISSDKLLLKIAEVQSYLDSIH